jgi:hypothetical protein
MKFSDLYVCNKCGVVYAEPVDAGFCMIARASMLGTRVCYGTVRRINYKPPSKDERQIDIDEYTGPVSGDDRVR